MENIPRLRGYTFCSVTGMDDNRDMVEQFRKFAEQKFAKELATARNTQLQEPSGNTISDKKFQQQRLILKQILDKEIDRLVGDKDDPLLKKQIKDIRQSFLQRLKPG